MPTIEPTPAVTHTSTVTEDQIDELGHMNVRFYAANAVAGTRAVLDDLGWTGPVARFDVYTRHFQEQLLGNELELRSLVLDADRDALRIHHELRGTPAGGEPASTGGADGSDRDGQLAATFVHTVRAVDGAGAPAPFPEEFVDTARERAGIQPDYARPRTVSLDADLLGAIPPLEAARAEGLAMRHPRRVTAEECRSDGSYNTTFPALLTWGGTPIEREDRGNVPYMTDDGKKMMWAAMENRITVAAWPRLGDEVQSFGAPIELFDKVSHRLQWVYDTSTGVVLNAFEVVSLAFDVLSRRPMPIPEHFRSIEGAKLRPELLRRTV